MKKLETHEDVLAAVAEALNEDPMALSVLVYSAMAHGVESTLHTLGSANLLQDAGFVSKLRHNEAEIALARGQGSPELLVHVLAELADKAVSDKIRDDVTTELKEKGIL